ncbi:hypothetical protein [Pseudomonas sp.]|uniref:hypothetical protein n=1 Tax=Pseudomonas sp. TaxID=306 RepID=UPI00258BECD5|nr:hypothetical protein [Pseudomonas sp.]
MTREQKLEEALRQMMRTMDKDAEQGNETRGKIAEELRTLLATPPQQQEGLEVVEYEDKAQPAVANTGSRTTKILQHGGAAGCAEVDGAANPDEASDAFDIFAWSTFDGEGGYDLRLYENNESYQSEWYSINKAETYRDWVEPLVRLADAQRLLSERDAEIERLQEVNRVQLEVASVHGEACSLILKERDQLRARIAELEAKQHAPESPHLNPPGDLPPVDCPILIELTSGQLMRAERTGHVPTRGDDMQYRMRDGSLTTGKFRWTYP